MLASTVQPDQILQRVLHSRTFAQSVRLRRFLEFVVSYAAAGRAEELKEYLIGVEVFDRPVGYDPRIDPIVRVEARRLRSKLRQYYESEGLEDPVRIELPTGTYAPVIRPLGETVPAAQKPAFDEALRTIAVLPFANLSPDPENEYFADGLSEELLTVLARIPGLRVIARTSVLAFRGKPQDVRTLGTQLGARVVLEGSVRKAGERVRIAARLIDVSDGTQLWSGSFDRETVDILAVQEEIANAIANALRLTLARKTTHPAKAPAYQLYLKGRYYWNKRTDDDLRRSAACFEEASREDPHFAPAYAGLADVYAMLGNYGIEPPCEAMPRSKQAAMRALELDGTLAEAHATLGCVHSTFEWDWQASERAFRRAIELDPQYASAYQWYAENHLAATGRLEQALEELRLAVTLDPLSLIIHTACGWMLYLSGRFDEAIEQYRKTLEFDPRFVRTLILMGRAYRESGRHTEAVAALEEARSVSGGGTMAVCELAACYAAAGRIREALATVDAARTQSRFVSPFLLAGIRACLGEREQTITALEQGVAARSSGMIWLAVHPLFAPYRSEPRIRALLRTMNLQAT